MSDFIKNHLVELRKKKFSYPEIELRALLNYCSLDNKEIFLNNFNLSKINYSKFKSAFQRRIYSEPLSKIFNNKEFWSFNFYVNCHVLDPRPESEFLIHAVKDYFTNLYSNIKICDLGTGSGCLAITLAKIYKNANIVATDISQKAIEVAKINSTKHNVRNKIKFINCNWIQKIEKFDLVVSNPPYISNYEYKKCSKNIIDFEPKIALLGGRDGLKSYREISLFASLILNRNSFLIVEIGKSQINKIKEILKNKKLKIIKIIKDFQSFDRILVIKKE